MTCARYCNKMANFKENIFHNTIKTSPSKTLNESIFTEQPLIQITNVIWFLVTGAGIFFGTATVLLCSHDSTGMIWTSMPVSPSLLSQNVHKTKSHSWPFDLSGHCWFPPFLVSWPLPPKTRLLGYHHNKKRSWWSFSKQWCQHQG